MRTQLEIKRDIEIVRQEIRYALAAGDGKDAEFLFVDLDELSEELHRVQTAQVR